MTGNELTKQVIDILVRYGWLVIRINSGGQQAEYTTKAGDKRSRYFWFSKWYASGYPEQRKGVTDLITVSPAGKWYALEIKGKGDKIRPGQVQFMEEIQSRNTTALVVQDLEPILRLVQA